VHLPNRASNSHFLTRSRECRNYVSWVLPPDKLQQMSLSRNSPPVTESEGSLRSQQPECHRLIMLSQLSMNYVLILSLSLFTAFTFTLLILLTSRQAWVHGKYKTKYFLNLAVSCRHSSMGQGEMDHCAWFLGRVLEGCAQPTSASWTNFNFHTERSF
jgi:hypothetical protein